MKKTKKILLIILFMFVFTLYLLPNRSLAWNNGDPEDIYFGERFGSHDWIALKANLFLSEELQIWLNSSLQTYLRGTAAPDNSSESFNGFNGYGDTSLHHNYYNSDGSSYDNSAATRAQEEYDKAYTQMQIGNYSEAAWFAGAMTHYIADLAVWGHVMTNETVHSNLENSANTNMDNPNEDYFQITFDGTYDDITANDASLETGWETYRGDASWQYNCNWLDDNYHAFDGSHPDDSFEERIEYLIQLAVNKITDLLYKLALLYELSLPNAPYLFEINPNPDYDGNVYLDWSIINDSTSYYIYRDINPITSTNSLTPIAKVTYSNYTDTISTSGTYFYAIIAGNSTLNGTISNCRSVFIQMTTSIPGFEFFITGISILSLIMIFYVKKIKISKN
ncbi:MAG: hypothetical protein EAX96_15790 [Candidatus Lokiarchaeota archaeon]|nr:hypothetical protein [Candidatus Lokiarchaeota archaeon]